MRRVLAVLALLILFLVMTAAGLFVAARSERAAQTAKPGWCCMPDQNLCLVQKDLSSCFSAGGILFNWDRDACTSACQP